MAADRLQSEFKDDHGNLWKVVIYDEEWGGGVTEFTLGSAGFTCNWNGNNSDTHQPIIGSDVEFVMFAENATHDSFLAALGGAYDERFLVKIQLSTTGISTGYNLWWYGNLLMEQVVRLNTAYPQPVTLTATDGLAGLKNKYYNNNGTAYTGTQTHAEIIANALDVPYKQFFTTSFDSVYFSFADHISSTQHYVTTRFLNHTRTNTSTFVKTDQTGDDRWFSCYEVLEDVCLTWGCRLFMSHGRFWVVPVNKYISNASSFQFHNCKKDGNPATDLLFGGSPLDLERDETATLKRLKGWTNSNLIPLKEVRRTQRFNSNLPLFLDYTSDNSDFPVVLQDLNLSYTTNTAFQLQGTVKFQNTGDGATGAARLKRIELRIIVQVGSKYLKRNINYQGTAMDFQLVPGTGLEYVPSVATEPEWTSNAGDRYKIVSNTFDSNVTQTANTAVTVPFNFATPPLPSDQSNVTVTVAVVAISNLGAASVISTGLSGNYFRMDILGEGGDTIVYRAVDDSNSHEVKDQGEILFGDVINDGGQGALEIESALGLWNTYVNTWESPNTTGGTAIHKLNCIDVLRIQKTARATVAGTLYGSPFYLYESLVTEFANYVPQRIRFMAQSCRSDVDAFQIAYNTTGVVLDEAMEPKDTRPPAIVDQVPGSVLAALDSTKAVVDGLGTGVFDVVADVETNTTAIAAVEADVSVLQADAAVQDANIATNAGNITTESTNITNLQRKIESSGLNKLGVFTDIDDDTQSSLNLTSTTAILRAGTNTSIDTTQTSPGTMAFKVQAGASGSEASVTALSITGSSTVNTRATVMLSGGDLRVASPTQFNAGATATFQDTATFNGTTSGISHDDLDDRPPLYHGIALDAAGTGGFLVGTGSESFVVGDLLSFTYDNNAGVYQCITATSIARGSNATNVFTNWLAVANDFTHIGARGDLSLGSLDSSTASDSFSDSLSTFTLTCSSTVSITSSTLIGLFGTVFSTGALTAAALTTTGTGTVGTLVASNLNYPTSDGTNGQALTTDGAGNLSFATVGGGGGGYSGPIPIAEISGRWVWSSTDSQERVLTGTSTYGLYNWYSHGTEPAGTTIRVYTGTEVVGTTNGTMSAFYLQAYSVRIPTTDKKVRVDFIFRCQNFHSGDDLGFSVWGADIPANGTTGSVTWTLLGESADVTTTTTSNTAVYSGSFTTPANVTTDMLTPMWEHRTGTLTTTSYIFGQFNMYLV